MKITLREFRKGDFPASENIIRETWHYDEFSSPKTASKLARVFLSSCFTNYTYSCVALLNNQPVGIILGKNSALHRCPLKYRIKQFFDIMNLFLSKEGRNISKIFADVNGIDKQLLKDCGKSYPGELALFAVSKGCRGKGIGKKLFQSVISYMGDQHIKEFYLYTDTSCNYGFYEHQGMIRRCEKDKEFNINNQEVKMTFFIYDYQL